MNYEQKYKDALERAIGLLGDMNKKEYFASSGDIENIFPELKESEDERIVRCLLNYFNHVRYNGLDLKGTDVDEVIAWLEKQGEQKQTWKPSAAQLIVIKDLIEDKNTSKVNKVVLRGMFDEFKQFANSQSSQFSSGHLLDSNKVIAWLVANICDFEYYVKLFKKDFGI